MNKKLAFFAISFAVAFVFGQTKTQAQGGAGDALSTEPIVRVFEGLVTDEADKPIAGASVEWGQFNHAHRHREIVRSDDEGRYRLETSKAGIDFRLGVYAEGFAPRWQDNMYPAPLGKKPPQVDFKLSAPVSLKGRVVDKEGNGVAGVPLEVHEPQFGYYSSFSNPSPLFPYPGPPRVDKSDKNGFFSISDLPRTRVMSKEVERGYPYAMFVNRSRRKVFSKEEIVLTVNPAEFADGDEARGIIRGTVVDAETQQPIPSFRTQFRHRTEMHSFANMKGEFQFDDWTLGQRRQMFVYAEDYEPGIQYAFPKKKTDTSRTSFGLRKSPSFVGRIVDSAGQPIAGAKLLFGMTPSDPTSPNLGGWNQLESLTDGYLGWSIAQRMTTGDDGKFWFCLFAEESADPQAQQHQKNNTPRMMILAPGFARRMVLVSELPRDKKGNARPIELSPGSTLQVSPQIKGNTVTSAKLHVSRLNKGGDPLGFSRGMEKPEFDANENAYVLNSLEADQYRIQWNHSVNGTAFKMERIIDVRAGESKKVVVNYKPGKNRLVGEAPRFSKITLTPQIIDPDNPVTSISATTNVDGDYRFDQLKPGKYRIESYAAHSQRQTYIGRRQKGPEPSEVTIDKADNRHDFKVPEAPVYEIRMPKS